GFYQAYNDPATGAPTVDPYPCYPTIVTSSPANVRFTGEIDFNSGLARTATGAGNEVNVTTNGAIRFTGNVPGADVDLIDTLTVEGGNTSIYKDHNTMQNTTIEGTLNFDPGAGNTITYAGSVLNNNAMNVTSGTVNIPGMVTSTAPTGALDYGTEVLADGPMLYYRFEEASGGGPAADSSGNALNGTYLNNATPGQPSANPGLGNAVDFDGADDSIEINHTITSEKMSVETWFFADALNGWRVVLNHDGWTGGNVHYQFNGNPMRWCINGNGGDVLLDNFAFNAGQWYHVVTTYDGATGETNLYVDGQHMQTKSDNGNNNPTITPGNIGAWNGNDREWDGRMDEFAIYDAVLTPAQVQHHYDVALGGGVKGGINVSAGAKLAVGAFRDLNYIDMAGDIVTTAGVTSSTRDLKMAAGATLDLQAGNLVVDYEGDTPFRDIEAKVKEGFADGAWAGTGITSSSAAAHPQRLAALACIDNSDPLSKVGWSSGLTSLDGVAVDATSILIKYTYYGDLNLDGIVDSNDYDLIDNSFVAYDPLDPINTAPAGGWRWSVGDVTYDGVVDSNDYDKIDNAFTQQSGGLGSNLGLPVPTPEPATVALLTLGSLSLLLQRRRRGMLNRHRHPPSAGKA
ncbi:MAG TPA: LamG-like jellyroll fold domain-containing protein, partial [Phycisphaerae bacterium]|nr:LamG-like jellyroll fold domain-containing protein [Phycisphaerae bacterium]